ncbi:ATP-binding protein [Cellulomonas cellasea]|uniref:sensor histidine kinase n=1 Tax=Cellulomonas cellasea TaxID=43670 RepID=UPI0025A3FE78|nr:sensor histidine kinase [Cellulomonas cellasea]MDM8085815.1 ATP-binding protein [Cellulomonas cellasea]
MSPALALAAGATTLRSRLGQMLVAAGVLLGLVVGAAGVALTQVVELQNQVTVVHFDAITRADGAYVRLVDAETAVRGYALTGDTVTLEPFERAADSATTFASLADDSMARGFPDGAAQAARVAADAAVRWQDEFAEPLIEQVAAQGVESVTPEQIEAGRALFDAARSGVEAYLTELRQVRDQAGGELATWTTILSGAVVVLVLAALAVGVALWVLLRRWITAPVAALAADARAVSSGELSHPVVVTGPGEIAGLALDMERMRRTLVDQLDALEQSSREVAQAHELLTEQAEELRRSNRDLEQFAYVASHDLQEPLRKVASFTQLLQKRYGGQLDDRADEYIGFAVDGAKRMQQLIQDLLGFSRAGRGDGVQEPVDLADALAQAVDNLDEAVTGVNAQITADDLPVVMGERALLVQLLQNLVGNAVKFRHPDRVPQIQISAHEMGDSWELRCTDNGIGIDPQYADRVFLIFQRLHPKDVYEGTGIGLALCKKIVEFHGGRIWIDPAQEIGASIRWTLPAAPARDN